MKREVCLFLFGLALLGVARGQGYSSVGCGENDCSDSKGGPICYGGKVKAFPLSHQECVKCNPDGTTNGDCMCDQNEYCVSDPESV